MKGAWEWVRKALFGRSPTAQSLGGYDLLATNTQLKELLAKAVTPQLPGFSYDGGYLWYGPWEDHCRKVVRVYLLKGAGAIFQWGLCFDFLPVINGEGRALHYQRTVKSVGLQLFCWPPDHWEPTPGRPSTRPCRFSLFGRDMEDVEGRLLAAFREAQLLFEPWFDRCGSLSGALAEVQRQTEDPGSRMNWPRPGYVLAFLLAANGRREEGLAALEAYLDREGAAWPAETKDKLRKKLTACGAE